MSLGIAIGLLLLLVGVALGLRLARTPEAPPPEVDVEPAISQSDRERVLHLLQELGAWTTEYSGNVSDYQNLLGRLSREVQAGGNSGPEEHRLVSVLEQIMHRNSQLQNQLDAAEDQLESQTRQIQCYLNEARTDALTGLPNRRAFDQKLEERFRAYRRGGSPFVVALIDVDHFKAINDQHGHLMGDQVLQKLASSMQKLIDPSAMVARYGGEEFSIVMDGPMPVAAAKLNAVRQSIARHRLHADDTSVELTISVGLSEPHDDLLIGPIVRRADEALYAAKHIGRNLVYYHDGQAPTRFGAPEVAKN